MFFDILESRSQVCDETISNIVERAKIINYAHSI
jgi:hypothetical protein